MALLSGNTHAIRQALKRLEDVGFSGVEVSAPGQEAKVAAAIKRGDRIPEKPVNAAFKAALDASLGEHVSPERRRAAVENALELAVRGTILSGKVEGPPRKTKVGKKLVDTGELARAVRAKAYR